MGLRKPVHAAHRARASNKTMREDPWRKPAIHGHFRGIANFSRATPVRNNFSARDLPSDARRRLGCGGARHLHTKLSGVTVIFFLL
jgi:hypothetical protein